jgi:ELWxxDGT repeat protein
MDTNLGKVVLVKDINFGFYKNYVYHDGYKPIKYAIDPYDSWPNNLVEFKDRLYFTAYDEETGSQIYVSDGTAEGTQLVVDNILPEESSYGYTYGSWPNNLVEFKDRLYFSADDGENGRALFVSDGTAEGTQLLVDPHPGEISYSDRHAYAPSNLIEFNDRLYFTANDGVHGNELFVSDGISKGTQLLVDLYPGENNYGNSNSSYPTNLVEFNDRLYFTANDGENGRALFVSDGTAEGTQLLVDLYPEGNNYGNSYSSYPSDLVEFKDRLYFSADDGVHGSELFVSDGTAEGTQLLVDLYPGENNYGSNNSSPTNLVEFNNQLYFTANNGESGYELFVSDGTAEGTRLLVDLRPEVSINGFGFNSSPSNLVEFNGKLYFTADDGVHGKELFVTDGTAEGTRLLVDLRLGVDSYGNSYGSSPSKLTVVGDELFFSADSGKTGVELFKLTFDDSIGATPILINGSEASENLLGSDRSEKIHALSGQDTVNSFGGNDYIDGGDGDDRLISNTGDDNLIGGKGKDTLSSGNGRDTLWGANDNDVLRGRGGNDSLIGGNNSDLLDGGIGDDTLDGHNGDDIFVLKSNAGSDTIVDFKLGSDRFGLANGLQFSDLSFANNTILAEEKVLATLIWFDTEQLTSSDFKTI